MNRIANLQILRAVAASLVVVDHAVDLMMTTGDLPADPRLLEFAWACGWIGVATFFAISGFIMEARSGTEGGSAAAARRFLLGRIVRIVPLYWIATALLLVSRFRLGTFPPLDQLLLSLGFIPYRPPDETVLRPLIGIGWTLNYEMFFYALFALTLALRPPLPRWGLPAFLVALVALGVALRSGTPAHDAGTITEFYSDPLLLLFAAGMGIALVLRRVGSGVTLTRPLLATTVALGAALAWIEIASVHFPLALPHQLVIGLLCVGATFACAACPTGHDTALGRALVAAGDGSFSTYLFHNYVLSVGAGLWRHLPETSRSPVVFIVLAVILANVAGLILFRLVERPLTERLRRALVPGRA